MDNKTKEGYLVSAGFVIVGLLFIFTNGWRFDITFFMGLGLSLLGIAGFKWPNVAELLVHWAKKQEESNIDSKQTQKNTKNSNQVVTNSGNVKIINNYLTKEKSSSPRVGYKIASQFSGTIKYNNLENAWFQLSNQDNQNYLVYIIFKFLIDNKEVIGSSGYYNGETPWNLNANKTIYANGFGIPKIIRDASKKGKGIKIKINCEIRDENNKFIEKKLPEGYVYSPSSNEWYLEP